MSAAQPWGPDLSHYQRAVDMRQLARAGASFVMLKATEGPTYEDPTYRRRHDEARAAGLVVGAYHFARPSKGLDTALAQAHHFLRQIGTLRPGDLPPVLDLEQTGGLHPSDLVAWAARFLACVHDQSGRQPMLYTYSAFAAAHLSVPSAYGRLTRYPLWLARYRRRPPAPPAPWKGIGWTFWQHSDRAKVAGVSGRCDRNVTSLSPAGLAILAHLHEPPADPIARLIPSKPRPPAAHKWAPAPAPIPSSWYAVIGARTLSQGSRGTDVKVVQHVVGVHEDGIYGPATEHAVAMWQAVHTNLTPDGIVGPKTWPLIRRQAATLGLRRH